MKSALSNCVYVNLAFHTHDIIQQIVQSEKNNQNDRIPIPSVSHRYVAVTMSSEGEFRQTMSPSATYFLPALEPSFGRNHYQNVSFLSIVFPHLVAFYDTLGIRRTNSRLKPRVPTEVLYMEITN